MEAATRRLSDERELEARLAEWQAKVICTWIGANAGVWMDLKQGQKNPLVEAVKTIDIFAGKDARQEELDRVAGPVVAEDWHDDPRLAPQAADPDAGTEAANPAGSFEAFTRMFGAEPPPNGDGEHA